MDFEEWKKENIYKGESKTWVEWCELAYEAGQQSKQVEIDALKAKVNDALEAFNDGSFNYCQKQLEEILK